MKKKTCDLTKAKRVDDKLNIIVKQKKVKNEENFNFQIKYC